MAVLNVYFRDVQHLLEVGLLAWFWMTPIVYPIAFLQRLAQYRRQLRVVKPKILHAHQMRASVIPLLAAYLEAVPIRIYHNHGLPYLAYRGALRHFLRSLERINIRLATHVLLVSRSNLNAARADGLLPHDKGTVLANGSAAGIDLAEYAPERFDAKAKKTARAAFGIADAAFVLAYVGRPVKRKGFHLLLTAWESSGLAPRGNVLARRSASFLSSSPRPLSVAPPARYPARLRSSPP